MKRIAEWYKKQSDTTKALIWLGVAAIIGIALRWNYIIDSARSGFEFYSGSGK